MYNKTCRQFKIVRLGKKTRRAIHFEVVSKLLLTVKESWALHSEKKFWRQLRVLAFHDWLRDKADAHDKADACLS